MTNNAYKGDIMINHIKKRCKIDGDCWIWDGYCMDNGYPMFRLGQKKCAVRPYIYKFFYKIDQSKIIHLTSICENPLCCNPAHLYPMKKKKINNRSTFSRFFEKVKKDSSGCWLWTGAIYASGYGQFYNGADTRAGAKGAHMELAHRVAYKLRYGEIPEGMLVLHTCDVRHCVNPDHLFLGTHKDNTQDMIKKGRAKFQKHH